MANLKRPNTFTSTQPVKQRSSMPFMIRRLTLASQPVQRVYSRTYETTAYSLYALGVMLRAVGNEQQAVEVEKSVDESFTTLANDMQAETARLTQLLEDNGIMEQAKYTAPASLDAQVSTRRASAYLTILEGWDKMIRILDTLRLTEIITDHQYREGVYAWQRAISRLAYNNASIVSRAIRTAHITRDKKRAAATKAREERVAAAIQARQERLLAEKAAGALGEEIPDTQENHEEPLEEAIHQEESPADEILSENPLTEEALAEVQGLIDEADGGAKRRRSKSA